MHAVDSEIMDRSKIATLDRHMHMQRRPEKERRRFLWPYA